MGAHVIPSFSMLRAFTLREPYDFVLVARRDTFAAVCRPSPPPPNPPAALDPRRPSPPPPQPPQP